MKDASWAVCCKWVNRCLGQHSHIYIYAKVHNIIFPQSLSPDLYVEWWRPLQPIHHRLLNLSPNFDVVFRFAFYALSFQCAQDGLGGRNWFGLSTPTDVIKCVDGPIAST
jgi:hypothetical protein